MGSLPQVAGEEAGDMVRPAPAGDDKGSSQVWGANSNVNNHSRGWKASYGTGNLDPTALQRLRQHRLPLPRRRATAGYIATVDLNVRSLSKCMDSIIVSEQYSNQKQAGRRLRAKTAVFAASAAIWINFIANNVCNCVPVLGRLPNTCNVCNVCNTCNCWEQY